MDNRKTIFVLGPNGRRHTIKVDANSTILQILEDVCKKQGLKAEEYDIKHHNKCLDTSTIIRFSGLPNNAQLELAEAVKTRLEGAVTLGLQLENGSRLLGSFTPDSTLWDILMQLCPEEADPTTNPVIIYMRRNIYSQRAFQDTNLRSLGITSGRAMLRLIHRSPEELGIQANVSSPLPSKPVEEKPYLRKLQKSDSPPETPNKLEANAPQSVVESKSTSIAEIKKNDLAVRIKEEKRKFVESPTKASKTEREKITKPNKEDTLEEVEFVFVGDRNAMVFSQETAHSVPTDELPEDFFELTITDAKKLLKDIKRRRLELENAPLQTSVLRNLQQSTREICLLNKYKKSIIRINFPDHTVLQGTFNPTDTIHTVMEFVKEYLENRKTEFYLYMAPPKQILDKDTRLMEAGCVPNAILYFGTNSLQKDQTYLRKDLVSKFTTSSVASLAAVKIRKETTRGTTQSHFDDNDEVVSEASDVNVGASTSTAPEQTYEDYPPRLPETVESQKAPKWFKPV